MEPKNWRTIAETIGIASLIFSLILVAWELNQANSLARTNVIFDFLSQHNEMHLQVASDPEMARLVSLLEDPNGGELGRVDAVRAKAIAERMVNIWDSIQVAYREGIISKQTYDVNIQDVRVNLERFPGLKPYIAFFVESYQIPGRQLNEIQRAVLEASVQ
ncbi:MAG: hypothetical protein O7C67_05050 [Gammaproteobacteria bacterium]|nr:hypothetical protein [Gammaproteobacteria bacterium]